MARFMTKQELAAYVGKSTRTVERWLAKGLLPPANRALGRSGFWLVTDVDRWLDRNYRKSLARLEKRSF